MTDTYQPPKVWAWDKEGQGRFATINRPFSGATHEKPLPTGKHPLQLYSLASPNGQKVTILLEELLALGHVGAEYDAWPIDIMAGEQFGSGFVDVNPNSKIPALVDHGGPEPIRLFESGAILLHLATKFGAFLPAQGQERADTLGWLFWQVASAPMLAGGFGHFYAYAPEKLRYPIDRYALEAKRQFDLLDKRLERSAYLTGDAYTIADIAVWPWYAGLVLDNIYEAGEFLAVHEYANLRRWVEAIDQRPAVQRGKIVNRTWGDLASQLPERHDAADIDKVIRGKTGGSGT